MAKNIEQQIKQNYKIHNMADSLVFLSNFGSLSISEMNFIFHNSIVLENGIKISLIYSYKDVYEKNKLSNSVENRKSDVNLDKVNIFETKVDISQFLEYDTLTNNQKEIIDDVQKFLDKNELISFIDNLKQFKPDFKNKKQEADFKKFYYDFYQNNDDDKRMSAFFKTKTDFIEENKDFIYYQIFQQDKVFDVCLDFAQKHTDNTSDLWRVCFDNCALNITMELLKQNILSFNEEGYEEIKKRQLGFSNFFVFPFTQSLEISVLENQNFKKNNKKNKKIAL